MFDTWGDFTHNDAGAAGDAGGATVGRVLDQLAQVFGCDRAALGRVVGEPVPAAGLDPDRLLERIGAAERLADAVHAVQVHDLAGFAAARRAEDHELGLRGDLVGRTAAIEVAAACTVATQTAQSRLCDAEVATGRLPGLLGLVGGGRVSMGGLRRVIAETWLLDPDLFAAADRLLAAEATSRRLSPGQL
nr:hypothetical protein [Nocardioidaceae bacterium]